MKYIISSLFTLALLANTYAQNAPVDFEPGGNGADWNWTVFENAGNPALEIVPNPDPTGINTSSTVAKYTALQMGAPFAGCETEQGAGIGTFTLTPATSTITIMVYKTEISDVGIKLVEAGFGSLGELKVPNTVINEWEEISIDFSSMEGIPYTQLVVFPDFQDRDSDNIIYFDNITFGELVPLASPMVPAPDPTEDQELVISMFSNTYTDVTVDTWLTDWSLGGLEDLQIDGNDTKKYSSLNFVGVESVGANLIDASEMDFFHVDVWSPNINTFRVKLVDFGADMAFEGGDDSEHELVFENFEQNTWVSLMIPIGDFTNLTSTEHLAQLIFSSANPVGSAVIYVDNVYYSKMFDSVSEEDNIDFTFGPNPIENTLQIQSSQSIEKVTVFNLSGKELVNSTDLGLNGTIDLTNLSSGVYLMNLKIGEKNYTERLIVD